MSVGGDRIASGATTKNPISVFVAIALIAVGLALGAIAHLYISISFVVAACVIVSVMKMANGPLPLTKSSQ